MSPKSCGQRAQEARTTGKMGRPIVPHAGRLTQMDNAQHDTAPACEGLQALAHLVEGEHPLVPADSDGRAFEVAWGRLAAAHRQGAAIVLLHRHGLGYDTAPNRRALLEHAARIWWLAEDG